MNKARQKYYSNFIEENSADQKKLFKASKSLLNLTKSTSLPPYANDRELANDIGTFFIQKISDIRSELNGQDYQPRESNSSDVITDTSFGEFHLLSESDVRELILASNRKSCPLDPIPTRLLIDSLGVLLPSITKMINLSLDNGYFPAAWKSAVVRPLLKKDGLDLVFKNFRPISNLQYISKLAETAVAKQLRNYMSLNHLFPVFQSAYRQHHSTETALLKVKNEILMNMNKQHVTLLVLLDLSVAFDTVDHCTLLQRLQSSLGVRGKVLSWLASYLSGRSQRILINETLSDSFDLECGVPQGSCLGPLLFTIYTSKLFEISRRPPSKCPLLCR